MPLMTHVVSSQFLIRKPLKESFDLVPYGVPDFPKLRLNLFFRSGRSRRICKSPVQTRHVRRRDRTTVIGVAAQRDHIIRAIQEFCIDGLRGMLRNIHTRFLHRSYGARIETMRLDAGAVNFHPVAAEMLAPPFRHLTAAGVPRAKKVNDPFAHDDSPLSILCSSRFSPRWSSTNTSPTA